VFRRLLTATAVLLALLHAWIFAGQAWSGALVADPALVARWAFAAVLVVALVAMRRRGLSLFRGREATAVWLVALLLHGPAVAGRLDGPIGQALPEVVLTLVTAVGAVAVAGAARGWRRPNVSLRRLSTTAPVCRIAPDHFHGAFVRFAPRPPPISCRA
jgi:hypothetical protein